MNYFQKMKAAADALLRFAEAERAKGERISDSWVLTVISPKLKDFGILDYRMRLEALAEVRRQLFAEHYDASGNAVASNSGESVMVIAPCYHSGISGSIRETRDGFWVIGPRVLVGSPVHDIGHWEQTKRDALKQVKKHAERAAGTAETLSFFHSEYLEALKGYFPNAAWKFDKALKIQEERRAEREAKDEAERAIRWKAIVEAGAGPEAVALLRRLKESFFDADGALMADVDDLLKRVDERMKGTDEGDAA